MIETAALALCTFAAGWLGSSSWVRWKANERGRLIALELRIAKRLAAMRPEGKTSEEIAEEALEADQLQRTKELLQSVR